MNRLALTLLGASLLLAACNARPEHAMPDVAAIDAKLAFTCAYEQDKLPPLNPEADQLFRYGRWLDKNNVLNRQRAVSETVARYYRIAAAHGHYKANINLQNNFSHGDMDGDIEEMLNLNDALIKAGVPMGYYILGHYIENGFGYDQNEELALKMFRHAADLGSKEAQYYVGDRLTRLTISYPEPYAVGLQMKRCAAEQGHGKAAQETGINLAGKQQYPEAIKYYQLGAKAGDAGSARWLANGFSEADPEDPTYLGGHIDAERAQRYRAISVILRNYAYANPAVPELDDIVPLPPAKLPTWDGKIQWLKDHEANLPPPKPSEELMTRLAEAKALDPTTGKPDPKRQQAQKAQAAQLDALAPRSASDLPLGTLCRTGERCPQSGVWRVEMPKGHISAYSPSILTGVFIAKGAAMPAFYVIRERKNFLLQYLFGYQEGHEPVVWKLAAYR
ncbi:sel1 repeat family protein [uncultured Aquitalea sp.]|uniref:SEL1-like repeat protein n=1 Tax=uncultured Aquitalea sp. TaxID=540272 RepID=UPI0025D21A5F|nr:sel1 repeat family protein [uncultured Aquitalea sp.]